MIPLEGAILGALILATLTFWLGHEWAIHAFYTARKRMKMEIDDLQRRVAIVNRQLDGDPERAAIDMGKRYILNQMDAALKRLRATIGE